MKILLIVFLSIFITCNAFAEDKLTTFDKETWQETKSQLYHIYEYDSLCSRFLLDDIFNYFYEVIESEPVMGMVNCGQILNKHQRFIWINYWALYAWNLLSAEKKLEYCSTYSFLPKAIMLNLLVEVAEPTHLDACYSPYSKESSK